MDEAGHIRQTGSPWEIFEQPVDSFVFNFMGIANFLPVRRQGEAYLVGDGTQNIPWKKPTGDAPAWTAGFRPSDVQITPWEAGTGESLRGVVRRASFLGAMMDYLIDVDGAYLRTSIETHEALSRGLMLEEGTNCAISFQNLHWFNVDSLTEEVEA
jgi:iron(III) transport system ATP-binding protein